MYNESILSNLGFNEEEIKRIMKYNEGVCEIIADNKNKVTGLKLNLNENVYEKLLASIEITLLDGLLMSVCCPADIAKLKSFEIVKLDKNGFKNNFNLNNLYYWVPYHSYARVERLYFIADSSNFLDFCNNEFNNDSLKSIEDKFGLKFDAKFESFNGECDDYSRNMYINNPIKNNNAPLILLTIYHYYQDGEPGYNCYDLKTKLYIVE